MAVGYWVRRSAAVWCEAESEDQIPTDSHVGTPRLSRGSSALTDCFAVCRSRSAGSLLSRPRCAAGAAAPGALRDFSPVYVRFGHQRSVDTPAAVAACPLHPNSGQANACLGMSASCHKRTNALQQTTVELAVELGSHFEEIRNCDPIQDAFRALQQFREPAIIIGLDADTEAACQACARARRCVH